MAQRPKTRSTFLQFAGAKLPSGFLEPLGLLAAGRSISPFFWPRARSGDFPPPGVADYGNPVRCQAYHVSLVPHTDSGCSASDAGVALVVAVTVVAEVGDYRRFADARQLMAYLGLVPSEHSSGTSIRRGGIAKAGNALARRVLIEGAWTK